MHDDLLVVAKQPLGLVRVLGRLVVGVRVQRLLYVISILQRPSQFRTGRLLL